MRRVLVLVFVIAAALVPAAGGGAQEGVAGIVLIMDASGSMNQEVGNGITLMDEAKAALREIVLRIPSGTEVGLRVYGHRIPNDDKARGCVDTELIVPVGPIERGQLLTAIGAFDAKGFTPIGLSLQEAAADLGPGGGTIILVSDGVDTCAPPDPCEVARQLTEEGITSHIHTVGLFLQDQAAVDQLQCIADAGNGTFTGVESVEGILSALTGVVDEAVEGGLEVEGIQGALQRQLAPVLPWITGPEVFGSLATAEGTIGGGEVRWYAVDVTEIDRQIAVSALFDWLPTPVADDVVSVVILDESGTEVGVPHEVAGVIVEAPQTMPLMDAADWLGDTIEQSFPMVLAVTDPVSMFPSWEPDESFFELTVDRFHEAGLNGGVYSLFKRQPLADPLEPGRYYIGVVWDGDPTAVRGMQVFATSYPVQTEEDARAYRPDLAVRVDDGTIVPFPLDPVVWSGDQIGAGLPEPDRAIEVWSALDGRPAKYVVALEAGEVLLAGWNLAFARDFDPAAWTTLTVEGPDGPVEWLEGEEFGRIGFDWTAFLVAPSDGELVITATLHDADPATEPAIALGVLVLPAAASSVLESAGLLPGGPEAGERPVAGELVEQAKAAILAGLRQVARDVDVGG